MGSLRSFTSLEVLRPVLSDLGNRPNRGSKHQEQRDRDQAKERRVRQIRLQIIAIFTLFWSNTVTTILEQL